MVLQMANALYQAIMPLFGFQSTAKSVKLDKDVWIIPISKHEIKKMQGDIMTIIDDFEIQTISHALKTEILKYDASEVNRVNDYFEKVLLGLRLFKAGDINQKVTFFKRKKGHGTRAFWKMKTVPYISLRPYQLKKDEIDGLSELLKKVTALDQKKRRDLSLPIHRFSKTYDDSFEDKYIDLMIAMESLVLLKGEGEGRSNIKEKIAIGVSMLIGRTYSEKRKVRLLAEKAYEIRNKIVHGTSIQWKKKEEKLYSQVEECLRRAIIRMLD
jgi:hypothetical protein